MWLVYKTSFKMISNLSKPEFGDKVHYLEERLCGCQQRAEKDFKYKVVSSVDVLSRRCELARTC